MLKKENRQSFPKLFLKMTRKTFFRFPLLSEQNFLIRVWLKIPPERRRNLYVNLNLLQSIYHVSVQDVFAFTKKPSNWLGLSFISQIKKLFASKGRSPFSECELRYFKIRSLNMRSISCCTKPDLFTSFTRLKRKLN